MFSDFLNSAGKVLGNAAKSAYNGAVKLSEDTMMYRDRFESNSDEQLRKKVSTSYLPLSQRLAAAKVLSERSKNDD